MTASRCTGAVALLVMISLGSGPTASAATHAGGPVTPPPDRLVHPLSLGFDGIRLLPVGGAVDPPMTPSDVWASVLAYGRAPAGVQLSLVLAEWRSRVPIEPGGPRRAMVWLVFAHPAVLGTQLGLSGLAGKSNSALVWPVDARSGEIYQQYSFPNARIAGLAHDVRPFVAPRRVWRIPSRAPVIRVIVAGGCPSTVGQAQDVENIGRWPASEMVPGDPTGGLVCRYGPLANSPGIHPYLYRSTVLDLGDADRLTSLLDRISTAPPAPGPVSCPEDSGSFTILAFSYPDGPDADVWYSDSGCPTLDNGRIGAWFLDNPSFDDAFAPTLNALSPPMSEPAAG